MARVVDLTDADADADALEATASGGILGGRLLEAPPADHLRPDETARYLLRNTSGVTVEGGTDLRPAEDYGAVAVVTDVRLLLLAGDPDGDEARSLPLHKVVEAGAESDGLLETTLVVETAGQSYRFPCRGDVAPAADRIDDDAGAWGAVERRLDDATGAIRAARDAADAGTHDRAFDRLDGVDGAIEAARERAEAIGPGAGAAADERVTSLLDRLGDARRYVFAGRGASAHAEAQAAWREREYETAAARYETAVASYREALAAAGTEPDEPALSARLDGAVRERAMLAAAPTTDADTARRRATRVDRPAEAARTWERALERYRDALGLDWGDEPRRFRVDRERVQERAAAVADAAIDAHREAADRWNAAGDRLADADPLYRRARDHVDRALELANEVRPGRTDALEDDRAAVEARLAGDEPDPTRPPSAAPDPPERAARAAAPAATPGSGEDTGATAGWAAGAELSDAPAAGRSGGRPQSDDRGAGPDRDDEPAVLPAFEPSAPAARGALADLDAAGFRSLVADAWAATGWSTTTLPGVDGAVHDVLAIRAAEDARDPDGLVGAEELLLWTVHDPEGSLPPEAVDRCVTARDRVGAGQAVLVTSATVEPAVGRRAADRGVALVGPDALIGRLREGGLAGRLGR